MDADRPPRSHHRADDALERPHRREEKDASGNFYLVVDGVAYGAIRGAALAA